MESNIPGRDKKGIIMGKHKALNITITGITISKTKTHTIYSSLVLTYFLRNASMKICLDTRVRFHLDK